MEKLYYDAPYTSEFEAEVLSCEEGKKGFEVILDKTAFYPEGGGQPSDTGWLGETCVLDVQEKAGSVIHYTEGSLTPGTKVKGILNWERRFINMQQHSGEHIVSGLIHARFGYDNVGFHMGNDEMTIDLNGILDWEQLMRIEQEANDVIYKNLELCITYPSEKGLTELDYRSKKELTGQVRIVTVPESDVCACCGTHVARTGEIGVVKFLSMIHYKSGVRISMLCGKKALLNYEEKTNLVNSLSVLLSAKTDKIGEAVERLMAELAERDGKINGLTRQVFAMKADQYEEKEEPLLVFEEELSPIQVRQFCNLLIEGKKGRIVAVCGRKEEGGFHYCIGGQNDDMRPLGKILNDRLAGRGGGSSKMIQGTFTADRQEIISVFAEAVIVYQCAYKQKGL